MDTHDEAAGQQNMAARFAARVPDTPEELAASGFTTDEIISLLWLRQWYQTGGSDRAELARRSEAPGLPFPNGQREQQG